MKNYNEILLTKYFEGKLSSDEQLHFDTLLNSDQNFSQEFLFRKKLKDAITLHEREKLKTFLKNTEKQSQSKVTPLFYYISIAAGFTILIAVSMLLLLNSSPNYEKLYAAHFEPYPNVIAPVVRENTAVDEEVAEAFRLYDSKKYDLSSTAFLRLYDKTNEDYAFFYYTISEMALGEDVQKIISTLENHHWNEPQNYEIITHWYLGLGYLNIKNPEAAIRHFNKVASSEKPLAKTAKKILEKLD
ncbi:MAG TPA: hypothetical protein VFD80_09890 [Flavobacteriaceae bacterium]|nr:hypothetical protein [Flavobacteriaceae bacterium]